MKFFVTFALLVKLCMAVEYIVISSSSTNSIIARAFPSARRTLRQGEETSTSNGPKLISQDDMILGTTTDGSRTVVNKVIGLIDCTKEQVAIIKNTTGVLDVVENGNVTIDGIEATTQWNLDRIDAQYGVDGFFNSAETGKNIDAYVLDTGVNKDHVAFTTLPNGLGTSRVEVGKNFLDTSPANADCNSHGSHVASTFAGHQFGVARAANIIPVKVMDCAGRGTVYSLVAGVLYARDQAEKKKKKSIINMSISSGATDVIDQAVQSAFNAGLIVVVAAGNQNSNACNYSPAREPLALTVSGTSEDDSRLNIANYGSCVDIYAPGENIMGAHHVSNTGINVKRGTSMAAPLVAGVAAAMWEKFPSYSNAQIVSLIKARGAVISAVMDYDCGGFVGAGEKIVQTYDARKEDGSIGKSNVDVRGGAMMGEFTQWMPDLAFEFGSDNEICITFNARVTTTRNGANPQQAPLRFALSSRPVPIGFSKYVDTPAMCRNEVNYYYGELSNTRAIIWGKNFIPLAYNVWEREPGPVVLSDVLDKPFYLSLNRRAGTGLSIEFGSGDGVSREDFSLVKFEDLNAPNVLSKLAFTSGPNFDLRISSVKECGADVGSGGEGATESPAAAPSVAINQCAVFGRRRRACLANVSCTFRNRRCVLKKGGAIASATAVEVMSSITEMIF